MPIWADAVGRSKISAGGSDYGDERKELRAANSFVTHMLRLQNPASERQRKGSLRWLGQSTRNDLYTVGAIVGSRPPRSSR